MLNSLLDIAMLIFGLTMLAGGWFVYKLAKLSKAWKLIWIEFSLFLVFLPGTRIVSEVVYGSCPLEDWLGIFLKIIFPLAGGVFFFLSFRKLFMLFNKFMGEDSENRRIK